MFFTNNSDYDLQKVGNQFCIEGTVIEAQQINGGNINRTYKVTYECENGSKKDYLFQKVNTYVFKNPVEVMENIDKVTTHIYHKRGGINALHFHHTKDRKNYYFEEGTGFFWRVRNYFDSVTFDVCNDVQILYLAVSGNVHAMFVIRYVGGRNIARSLAALQQENIRLLVTSLDPSLTAKHITEAYRLPEGMVTLLDQEQCAALEAAPAEDAPCCMYHQKGFASLTGGLRAADKAQNAETTATTVQMVSVLFSVAIAVLLTSARSIWQLPVTYVLMYQAAWSALSIAVCALKQHN